MKISRATENAKPDIADVMDSFNSLETNSSSNEVEGAFPVDAADMTTASERMIPILGRTNRRQDCRIGSRSFGFGGGTGLGFAGVPCIDVC
jgi:hypothetical protein